MNDSMNEGQFADLAKVSVQCLLHSFQDSGLLVGMGGRQRHIWTRDHEASCGSEWEHMGLVYDLWGSIGVCVCGVGGGGSCRVLNAELHPSITLNPPLKKRKSWT